MLGEEGAGFFERIAFAASHLVECFIEIGVDCFFVAGKPVLLHCLGLNEIEGVSEQLGRLAEGPAVKLALDSLFDGCVESDGHGMSIGRGPGRRRAEAQTETPRRRGRPCPGPDRRRA